jgi:chromosome segregation ATPase
MGAPTTANGVRRARRVQAGDSLQRASVQPDHLPAIVSKPAENASAPIRQARELARLEHDAELARSRSRRSAKRVVEVEQELAVHQSRTVELEGSLAELSSKLTAQMALVAALSERVERADRVIAGIKSSLSWRVTAPLRALKRLR